MEGPSILHRFQEMIMTASGETDKLPNDILQLTNELKTTSEKTFFAYSLPGFGIVICGFPSYEVGNFDIENLVCNIKDAQVIPLVRFKVIKLYKGQKGTVENDELDMYFYGICSQPPSILEFDISNIENTILHKIY
jgi:hypothetical protein